MYSSDSRTENSKFNQDDFRLPIIAILLIFYVAVAPCICFCFVTCVKNVKIKEKPPSPSLVCEGL